MTKLSGTDSKSTLYCSFCGKSQHEVRKLIAGPTVFICDEPVATDPPPPQSCTPDGADGPETTTCQCTTPLGEAVDGQPTCLEDGSDFGACNCGCRRSGS